MFVGPEFCRSIARLGVWQGNRVVLFGWPQVLDTRAAEKWLGPQIGLLRWARTNARLERIVDELQRGRMKNECKPPRDVL